MFCSCTPSARPQNISLVPSSLVADPHAARGRIVTAERQRTQIAAPNAQPDAFIVYGRVLDSAGNPKKGVKVDATGASGALVTSTQSGGDGSFQLSVPASAVAPRQSATLEKAVPAEKVDAAVGPPQAW